MQNQFHKYKVLCVNKTKISTKKTRIFYDIVRGIICCSSEL